MICVPAGPGLAEIQQPSATRDTRTLAMVQGTRRPRVATRHFIVHANRKLYGDKERGRQFFRKTNHIIWTVADSWIIYMARSTVY